MVRKPRQISDRLIDIRMWSGVLQIGLVTALATLLTLDLFLPGGLLEGTENIETARTAAFSTLVFAQLVNCFNARSETASALRGLFANRWLWAAVTLGVILQVAVVNLKFMNLAFNTVPLTIMQWMTCIAISSSVLWYSECRKLLLRLYKAA